MKKETFTINKHVYITTPLSAMKAFRMSAMISPLIGSDGLSIKNIMLLLESDPDNKILFDLLSRTTRDGHAILENNFDNMFDGELVALTEVLAKVFAFNFGGFFLQLGTGLQKEEQEQVVKVK